MAKGSLSIHDVARQAGVSAATVSRVLNEKPDVAPATRDRIQKLLSRSGFRLHRTAVGLSTGRTGLIALLVGELTAFSEGIDVTIEIARHAAGRAYGTVLWLSDLDADAEASYAQILARGSVDGAIITSVSDEVALLERLEGAGLPLVLVEPNRTWPQLSTVRTDAAAAGELAVRHLTGLGHRRIGIITVSDTWVMGARHLAGYRAGLEAAGIERDPALELTHDWTVEMGRVAGQKYGAQLLGLPDAPSAIVCCSDNLAFGVVEIARDQGLVVPDHLSVVGFDDIPLASVAPGLTTLRDRAHQLGRTAAKVLLDLLQGERHPREILLEPDLAVRGSTAPPHRPD